MLKEVNVKCFYESVGMLAFTLEDVLHHPTIHHSLEPFSDYCSLYQFTWELYDCENLLVCAYHQMF